MNDTHSLNSTERLLNTIRGDVSPAIEPGPLSNITEQSISFHKTSAKNLTAGVLIEENYIALTLTCPGKSPATQQLLKWSFIQMPKGMTLGHNRFVSFLKQTLDDFLDKYRQAQVWTAIDTKNFKLRHIIIPDLAPSKIANAALWGFKKEFEIQEEEDIFDFQVLGTTQVDGIQKRKVVVFSAEKKQVSLLKSAFSKAGFPLTGITALPFAFHNFVKAGMVSPKAPFVMAHVSRNHSNVFCMAEDGILLVRNIRSGSFSLAEDMVSPDTDPNDITIDIPQMLKFEDGDPDYQQINEAANRLISKIIRTGDYCSNQIAGNEPMNAYLFSGEIDECTAFVKSAEEQIPSRVDRFNPFDEPANQPGVGIAAPFNAILRNGIIQAFALSMSTNQLTPNFLFTYVHKEAKTRQKKINIGIAGAFAACMFICFAAWFWMGSMVETREQNLEKTSRQLAGYVPNVQKESLDILIAQARKKSNQIEQYTQDYLSLAVIGELCTKTPENIKIISMDADFRRPKADEKKEKHQKTKILPSRALIISGTVSAEFTALESTLTGYIISLSDSPFFNNVVLKEKKVHSEDKNNRLTFTAVMEIN